jgi:hypothetical protein
MTGVEVPPAASTCRPAVTAPKDVVATVAVKPARTHRRVIEHKWLMATSPKLNTYTSVLWCDTLGRSYLGPLETRGTAGRLSIRSLKRLAPEVAIGRSRRATQYRKRSRRNRARSNRREITHSPLVSGRSAINRFAAATACTPRSLCPAPATRTNRFGIRASALPRRHRLPSRLR